MAEKVVKKSGEQKPKRQVRAAVETVREKAVKQEEAAAKPRRLRRTRRAAGAPLRVVGRTGKRLNRITPLRWLGLILVPPYFRNSWRELRQVTWPTFKMSRQLTAAVAIFAFIFGIFVAVLDFGLDKLFKQVLIK